MDIVHLSLAATGGVAVIIALIGWAKLNPFLSLMIGSATMAVFAGMPYEKMWDSFTKGFGSTTSSVGILIVLGSIIGTFLVSSGGADAIVDTIVAKTTPKTLPWAMALIAFAVGIPLFFEVGVVILIPVVIFAVHRAQKPLMLLAIPALAGLSAMHAFLPPHPGPLVAIDALKANLGVTLGLGLAIGIPTVIVSGPLLGKLLAKYVPVPAPPIEQGADDTNKQGKRPSFAAALSIILLPVVLMLASSIIDLTGNADTGFGRAAEFVGKPITALFLTTLAAMALLGTSNGISREKLSNLVSSSFGPIAGILLIVAAGGGFKQTLVDSGIADAIASTIHSSSLNPLFAGWLVAVLIRLATGSATVATVTASGIMVPLAANMSEPRAALLVLAIGAGSVFFSHVNDAGFWLVKEYFHLSVKQTLKTWSLMETVLSVFGLVLVLLVSLFLG